MAEAVRQIVYDALHQEQLGQRLRARLRKRPRRFGKQLYRDGAAQRAGCRSSRFLRLLLLLHSLPRLRRIGCKPTRH